MVLYTAKKTRLGGARMGTLWLTRYEVQVDNILLLDNSGIVQLNRYTDTGILRSTNTDMAI